MPIITLYGTKGGTGRTTSAAALALGFIQTGKVVTVIDATNGEPWLTTWADQAQSSRIQNDRLTAVMMSEPSELASFLSDAENDPDQVFIIDTAKHVSAVRSIALEFADLVIVPFRQFLDAESAVRLAASQIPRNQQIVGLSLSGQSELSVSVHNCMPVLDTPVLWDDRFDLFGSDASVLVSDAIQRLNYEPPTHPDISLNLTELAGEVQKRLDIRTESVPPRHSKSGRISRTLYASLASAVRWMSRLGDQPHLSGPI